MQPGPANLIRSSVEGKTVTSQAIPQMASQWPGEDFSSLRAVVHVRAAHTLQSDKKHEVGSTSTVDCTPSASSDGTRETIGVVRPAREVEETKRGERHLTRSDPAPKTHLWIQGYPGRENWSIKVCVGGFQLQCWILLLNPCLMNSFQKPAQGQSRLS